MRTARRRLPARRSRRRRPIPWNRGARHRFSSPRTQKRHAPQVWRSHAIPTRSPMENRVAPAPQASTRPTTSCPGTTPKRRGTRSPSARWRSVRHTPHTLDRDADVSGRRHRLIAFDGLERVCADGAGSAHRPRLHAVSALRSERRRHVLRGDRALTPPRASSNRSTSRQRGEQARPRRGDDEGHRSTQHDGGRHAEELTRDAGFERAELVRAPMKTFSTARTRPRAAAGVTKGVSVARMNTLTASAALRTTRAESHREAVGDAEDDGGRSEDPDDHEQRGGLPSSRSVPRTVLGRESMPR